MLKQLSERVYVCEGGVNIAVIVAPEKRLILVDSGLDSGTARKALRPLLEQGYSLTAIINSHSHADHIGGNADLVKRTGCQVWAPPRERLYILWPELEPLGLFGAAPPPSMQVKFLQAQPTPEVHELPAAPCRFTLEGVELESIALPGHALEQVGIAIDGLLVVADGLFMPEIIERHPIMFLVNVADYLESLERIGARGERYVLPGHGPLVDRQAVEEDPLPAILAANRAAVARIQEAMLAALVEEPLTSEELLCQVVERLGKNLASEPQYFLDRAAVAAHTSYLLRQSRIEVQYHAGRRILKRA